MNFQRVLFLVTLCALIQGCLLGPKPAVAQVGPEEAFQRGTALEDSGRVEQAIEVYSRLYREHPERLDFLYRLEEALVKSGRGTEGVALLKQRLARAPTDGRAQIALGDAYFAMGRQREAVKVLEGMIEGQPNAGVFALVASRYRSRGLPERAVGTYLRGREKIGEPTAFSMELAGVYEEQGQYRDSIREYLLVLKENPQIYPTVDARIQEIGRQGDAVEEAQKALVEAVRAAPEDALRLRLLTSLSLSAGRPEAALTAFLALGRRDPQAEAMLLQVGTQCEEAKAHATALAAYRALIDRFPSSSHLPQAILGSARAEEGAGNPARAVGLYDEVRRRFPGTLEAQEACFRSGEVRRRSGQDPEGALKAYRDALKVEMGGPWQRPSMLGIGACLVGTGDLQGALRAYDLICRLAPGSAEGDEAAFRAAEATYLMGRFAEAQQALETLLSGPTTRDPVNDALDLADVVARGMEVSAAYLQGYADADLLSRKGMALEAAKGFEAFAAGVPEGPLADRAEMAAAQLKAGLGRYVEAAEAFRKVAASHPHSPLAPEGLLQAAILQEDRLGGFQEAIRGYEAVLTDHPDSPQVEKARKRLRRLQERIRG